MITLKANPDKDQIYAAFNNAQPYGGTVYVDVYNSKTGTNELITTPFKAINGTKIGLAIDSDDNIYVAYVYSGVQVQKYNINTKTWQSLTHNAILPMANIDDIHLSYDKHEGLYLAFGVLSVSAERSYAAFYHYTGSAFNQVSTLKLSTFYGGNSGNNADNSIRFKVIKGGLYFAYIAPESEISQENSVYFDRYDLTTHIWQDYSAELATLLTHSVWYFDMQVDDLGNLYFVSQSIIKNNPGDVIVVKGKNWA